MNGEQEFAREKAKEFNNYLKLFPRFYDDSEEVEADPAMPTQEALERELLKVEGLDSLDSTLIN